MSNFQYTSPVPGQALSITNLGEYSLDGSSAVVVDLSAQSDRGQISEILSVWVDASSLTRPVRVSNPITTQYISVPAFSQAWQPLMVKSPVRFEIRSDAVGTVAISVSNYPLITAPANAGIVIGPNIGTLDPDGAQTTPIQLLFANPFRRGATLYSEPGSSTLYVGLAGTVNLSSYTVRLYPGDYYEVPFGYTGDVWGVWDGTSGGVRLTEIS